MRTSTRDLAQLVASEAAWRNAVAEPLVQGKIPKPAVEQRLTRAVTNSGDALATATRTARDDSRDHARTETRNTTLLVAAGLAGALLAALILFSGLINSMRAPLGRLVEGARRLAGGDLRTRVEVGGPRRDRDARQGLQRDGELPGAGRARTRPGRADEGRLRAHRLARAAHAR